MPMFLEKAHFARHTADRYVRAGVSQRTAPARISYAEGAKQALFRNRAALCWP